MKLVKLSPKIQIMHLPQKALQSLENTMLCILNTWVFELKTAQHLKSWCWQGCVCVIYQ